MKEWYRRHTWTKTDEEEFFTKLSRARKSGRAQYLKIQAIELISTKKKELLLVAESLLKKMLSEYPDDNFNKSLALHTLGDIYKLRDNNDEAIKYYKQALDHEIIYPNVKTQAYIDYAELIIKTGLFDQFDFVENILLERVPEILFPLTKYKAFSILAIIYNHKDKPDQAKEYIDLAELNASAETSGLRYHKYLGVVKDRDSVLDRLVKRD